jgi:hypothetical protein
MKFTPQHAITVGLLGIGACAWAFSSRPLAENAEIDVPLNPFGINTSPYGEVFAMAMQGPIDLYWHKGTDDHDHEHGHDHDHDHLAAESHDHEHGPDCEHDHDHDDAEKDLTEVKPAGLYAEFSDKHVKTPAPVSTSLRDRFRIFLDELGEAGQSRTNHQQTTAAHTRFMRRGVEDKLKFAYHLDPAHYGNYNSYHFFLTEPQLGTRPVLSRDVAKLAQDTIDYCLKDNHDPRPALTAAAAAENVLELMFNDQHNPTPQFNTAHMRHMIGIVDTCLARHLEICREWDRTGNWELLSPLRRAEIEDRFRFITRVRESAEATIARLEGKAPLPQANN